MTAPKMPKTAALAVSTSLLLMLLLSDRAPRMGFESSAFLRGVSAQIRQPHSVDLRRCALHLEHDSFCLRSHRDRSSSSIRVGPTFAHQPRARPLRFVP